MQHDLYRVVGGVGLISLAPVITNGVGKDGPGLVEFGGRDAATNVRIAFQSVLRVLVPEMECAVATSCAESSMLRVEGDVVHGIDIYDLILGRVSVAFEGEVRPVTNC